MNPLLFLMRLGDQAAAPVTVGQGGYDRERDPLRLFVDVDQVKRLALRAENNQRAAILFGVSEWEDWP